eukprot:scaffold3342_cov181-Pinguiococcus_pyrenoidosus.AAC.2
MLLRPASFVLGFGLIRKGPVRSGPEWPPDGREEYADQRGSRMPERGSRMPERWSRMPERGSRMPERGSRMPERGSVADWICEKVARRRGT